MSFMRTRRTIPLHVLPAFEAAARHGGFRGAAQELHLTPSAISHQIKLLEDALGVPLFRRTPRGLVLTAAGAQYRTTAREVLQRLQREADALSDDASNRTLRVSMPDYVAEKHFVPGLREFRSAHPNLRVEISVSLDLADVEGGAVDAAIRMGGGVWGKLWSHKLADIWATPVAAPDLALRARELSERGELPFVYLGVLEQLTCELISAAGLPTRVERGLPVNNYRCLLEAVQQGLGVGLLMHSPQWRPKATRRYVPLSEPVPMPFSMYLVCRQADAERSHLRALREWLINLTAPWMIGVSKA